MFSMYRAVPLCRRAVPLCRRAVPLCRSRWQTLPCTRSWPLSYRTTPPRWTGSRSSVTTGSWWSNTPTSGTTSPTDRTMSCNVWGSVDTLMGVAHCLQGNKSVRTGLFWIVIKKIVFITYLYPRNSKCEPIAVLLLWKGNSLFVKRYISNKCYGYSEYASSEFRLIYVPL